MAQELEEEEGV